jgi:uncharacterized protein YegL
MQALSLRLAILALAFSAVTAAAEPNLRLAYIAIVDKSGSMAEASKLLVAIKEVLELAHDHPPSALSPFIIVPFDGEAHEPQVFTEYGDLERFANGLVAGGGTSIASGLERGCDALAPYMGAAHLVLFLVTDGEDRDVAGIQRAEARLGHIFAHRHQENLSNTVFIKRWENANSELVQRIEQMPGVDVFDLGADRPVGVDIEPRARVLHARWMEGGVAHRLRVEVEIESGVSGDARRRELPELEVEVSSPVAVVQGDVLRQLSIAQDVPQVLSMVLTLQDDSISRGATVPLTFVFSMPAKRLDRGPLRPLVHPAALTVDLLLPVRQWTVHVSPTLVPRAIEWLGDGLAGSVTCSAQVDMLIDSQPDIPWPGPATIRLDVDPKVRVVEGNTTIEVPGPGHYQADVRVEYDSILLPDGKLPSCVRLEAKLSVDSAHQKVDIAKKEFDLAAEFIPPAALQTQVAAEVAVVQGPRWVDLRTGQAEFEVEINLAGDGPMPTGSRVSVVPTGNLRPDDAINVPLISGQATARINLTAPLQPRQLSEFAIEIDIPNKVVGGRVLTVQERTAFEVAGPEPAVLALAFGGRAPRPMIELMAATDLNEGVIDIIPQVVTGPTQPGVDMPVRIASKGLGVAQQGQLVVGRRSLIRFDMTDVKSDLFDDVVHEVVIELVPEDGQAAAGSRTTVHILQSARMKQLLALGTLGVMVGLAVLLVMKVIMARDLPDEGVSDEPLGAEAVS